MAEGRPQKRERGVGEQEDSRSRARDPDGWEEPGTSMHAPPVPGGPDPMPGQWRQEGGGVNPLRVGLSSSPERQKAASESGQRVVEPDDPTQAGPSPQYMAAQAPPSRAASQPPEPTVRAGGWPDPGHGSQAHHHPNVTLTPCLHSSRATAFGRRSLFFFWRKKHKKRRVKSRGNALFVSFLLLFFCRRRF